MKNFTQLKSRIKRNEGYNDQPYLDVLGYLTVGYGHLIKKNEKHLKNTKQSKKKLSDIFDLDFNKALKDYLRFYKKCAHNKAVEEVYLEMIFQLGIKNQIKFVKMNSYIEKDKFFMAAFEMKNSLWYKQTPKRVEELIDVLLEKKYEKKR